MKIITDDIYTLYYCECGVRISGLIQIGEEPSYESATAKVCRDCSAAAFELIDEERRR